MMHGARLGSGTAPSPLLTCASFERRPRPRGVASSARALGSVGLSLLVIAGAVLWLLTTRPPEPMPASLGELERIVGEVDTLSEDLRPLYTTRHGNRTIVHPRKHRAWRLTLKASSGQRSAWSIPGDVPDLTDALARGTSVTAYVRAGRIDQLETASGTFIDLQPPQRQAHTLLIVSLLALFAAASGLSLCTLAVARHRGVARS
jgi:hypothetical protein